VKFFSSPAIYDDATAARRKDEQNVAHNNQTAHNIDFKHASFDVALRALVLVFANIVPERGEDIFLDTRDAHQEIALATHVHFRRR